MVTAEKLSWVLMSYRIPREPSTPRIAIWRRLKKLGVAQVGDGLVALPHNARTKEDLEWVSAMVHAADGDATVWVATTTKKDDQTLTTQMNEARTAEYQSLLDDIATVDDSAAPRTLGRLRREWRRIDKRDYFRAPLREQSKAAVEALAESALRPKTEAQP